MRQRYVRTDVSDGRHFTVDVAVLKFWCSLYCLGMSSSTLSSVIAKNGKEQAR